MTMVKKGSTKLLLALFGIVAANFLIGCGGGGGAGVTNGTGPPPAGTTTYSDSQPLGGGTARSYVTIGSDGTPKAVGVQLTAAVVSGLSDSVSSRIVLPLPAQASVTPLNHIDFVYQATGHFPPGLFDVPQFAVSFFSVTQAFRQQILAIGPDNLAKLYQVPSNDEAPPTYFELPGSGVAGYGMHYAYFQAPEFVNEGFTDSLDLLYYNGHLIGEEPLVSVSYLRQNNSRVDTLETPKKYPHPGYWPTQNALRYDPVAKVYTISLEGFVNRN